MPDIVKLRQIRGQKIDELNTDTVIADPSRFAEIETEIADLDGQIDRATRAETRAAGLARPLIQDGTGAAEQDLVRNGEIMRGLSGLGRNANLREVREVLGFQAGEQHFQSFGEYLAAVAGHYRSHGSQTDARLTRAGIDQTMTRAPSGTGTVDPTGGGFLVQTDFANMVFTRAYAMGEILSRVTRFSISTGANGIKIPGIDETSRATGSRYGGVQSYWLAEGDAITTSKPKFRLIELDLKKLASAMYVTDELLADTNLLDQIATQAFAEEIAFMTEDAIFEGNGIGKPLGILSAPATVTVPKITGQQAGSIVKENIDSMYAQLWARSRDNAVWLINQLVWPQLLQLGQVVGTGGMPIFLPAGTVSGKPYSTLYGIPVKEVEYCSAPGTPGDIVLADFSQYALADKGGVQAASSMHVQFLSDQMTFRIIYRVDGKPLWSAPLTPFKGASNLSSFIKLAQR